VAAVAILDRDPVAKTVLGEYLIAEVPLAHVGAFVVGVVEQFGQAACRRRQGNVVGGAAGGVGPQARQDRRP